MCLQFSDGSHIHLHRRTADRTVDVTRQSSDPVRRFCFPPAGRRRIPRHAGAASVTLCARAAPRGVSVSDGARAEQSTYSPQTTLGMIADSANDLCCSLQLSTSKECVRP